MYSVPLRLLRLLRLFVSCEETMNQKKPTPLKPLDLPEDPKVDVQRTWRKHGWKPRGQTMSEIKAYRHWEDGKQWLRLCDKSGNEWDESITGWTEVLNLTNGHLTYRHKDGREVCGV